MTTRVHSKYSLPTHHFISSSVGLKHDSIILLEQIRAIDKATLREYNSSIGKKDMIQIERKIIVSLGINNYYL